MEFIEITMKNVLEATNVQMEIFGVKDCAYLCYIQHIRNQDPPYYIVKENNEVIGISGIYVEPFEPDTAWLGWFGVKSNFRNKGYGTKILNKTIEIARENGYKNFRLYTDVVNPNAHRLYDKVMDYCEEYNEPNFKVLIYSKSLCEAICPKLNNKFINLASKDKEQDNGYELYLSELVKNNTSKIEYEMLSFDDFIKMEEIDHQYFPEENISPALEAYKWYLADQNSCITIKDNSTVIAYVNILSLKKDVYDKIKNNKMNESEILVSDLELNKNKYFNYLYFSTIAIDKNHRDIATLRKLIDITTQKLVKLVIEGCKIKEVMADCSTLEGQKITQRFLKLKPFKKTSHNSMIHILSGEEFMKFLQN